MKIDTCVDLGAKSRLWRLLTKLEKLGRGWLFPFGSWFWNILPQGVDYSGLLLLLGLLLRTVSGLISTSTRSQPLLGEEVRAVNFATH